MEIRAVLILRQDLRRACIGANARPGRRAYVDGQALMTGDGHRHRGSRNEVRVGSDGVGQGSGVRR